MSHDDQAHRETVRRFAAHMRARYPQAARVTLVIDARRAVETIETEHLGQPGKRPTIGEWLESVELNSRAAPRGGFITCGGQSGGFCRSPGDCAHAGACLSSVERRAKVDP